jgi:hypothetical protein
MTAKKPSKAYLRERAEKFEESVDILSEALVDIIKCSSDNRFKCHMIAKLKCTDTNDDIQERICSLIQGLGLDQVEVENESDEDFATLDEVKPEKDENAPHDQEFDDDFEDLEQAHSGTNRNLVNLESDFEFFGNNQHERSLSCDDFGSLGNQVTVLEHKNENDFDLLLKSNTV